MNASGGTCCRACGATLGENAAVCTACGAARGNGAAFCPGCGAAHGPQADFCTTCGSSLHTPGAAYAGGAYAGAMGAAPNSFSSVLPQAPGNAIPEAALRAWTWGPFWSWLFWPFWNGDTLLKGLAVGAFVLSFFTGGLTALALAIYLGVRGNRIAAAFRQFSSVDEFFVVQRAWSRWGLILTIIGVVIPLGLFMLGMIFSIFINGVSEHHYS